MGGRSPGLWTQLTRLDPRALLPSCTPEGTLSPSLSSCRITGTSGGAIRLNEPRPWEAMSCD